VAPIVLIKRLHGISGLSLAAATLVLNAAGFAPFALRDLPSSLSTEVVVATVVLAVACTALAFLFYFALIHEVGPSRSALITYVNPLVAVLLGVVVLSEPLTLGIAIGTPLILAGSFLATAPSLGKSAEPAA
jgi:drug/metabolite transporter (DMT)-like permease